MTKTDDLLLKIFAHPKVGPALDKLANADKEQVDKVGKIIGNSAGLLLSGWYVKRALREFGFDKKQAAKINTGAQCAVLLGSYYYTQGKLRAEQIYELTLR